MAQRNLRASVRRNENVLSFSRPTTPGRDGAKALDLVYQAADLFRSMEDRARDTEARAQSLCQSAAEKLRHAETRAETAEREQRELIISTDHRLREASRALEQAQLRLEAQQNQLTAVEFRAQAAEAEARQAKQALALVEEAIQRRLLCTKYDADSRLAPVA